MVFKLKTSAKTGEIFEELARRTYLKPYTLSLELPAFSTFDTAFCASAKGEDVGIVSERLAF